MKRMKTSLMAILLLTAGLGGGSCSEEGLDEQLADCQASFKTDVYGIGYSLKNEKGRPTSTFKAGEGIIFDVTVYNASAHELHLADTRDILYGAASVFRSNGEYVGNPYVGEFQTMELRWFQVAGHDRCHWEGSWTKEPLPKGEYYSLLKCRVLKHVFEEDISGYDDIELKIPFTVK